MNTIDRLVAKLEMFGEGSILRFSDTAVLVRKKNINISSRIDYLICMFITYNIELYTVENGKIKMAEYDEFYYNIDEEIAVGIKYNDDGSTGIDILDNNLYLIKEISIGIYEKFQGITKDTLLIHNMRTEKIKIYNYASNSTVYMNSDEFIIYYKSAVAKKAIIYSDIKEHITLINNGDIQSIEFEGDISITAFGNFKYYDKKIEGILVEQVYSDNYGYDFRRFILTTRLEIIDIEEESCLKLITTQEKVDKFNLIQKYIANMYRTTRLYKGYLYESGKYEICQ